MKPWVVALLVVSACTGEDVTPGQLEEILQLSPLEAAPVDPTNAEVTNTRAADLGEVLFFDSRLSSNGEVSCATCHKPEHGFADNKVLSEGLGTTERHSPSVLNTAWNRWFFWDGRADSAWSQALKPIESEVEQDFNRLALAHLIRGDDSLRPQYEGVFGALPDLSDPARFPLNARPLADTSHPDHVAWAAMTTEDQDTINRIFTNTGKAIAAFEHTLSRSEAPFDRYVAALRQGDPFAIEEIGLEAYRGLSLFVGRANCVLCHSGPTLSDLQFHNLGLTPPAWMDPTDRGRYDGIIQLQYDPFNGAGNYSDAPEIGAQKISFIALDVERLGQFKTPTLRNVALSPPYMHGGQLASLEEVVAFYNEANQEPTVGHRDEVLVPLELTEQEKMDLVAFLETLTGDPN